MVPLYLPEEQRTSPAAAPSTAPVRQQRGGEEGRDSGGAQGRQAPQSGGQYGLPQRRTDFSPTSVTRSAAPAQQRTNDAPASNLVGVSGRPSSDARAQQLRPRVNGVDAQRMASAEQPQIESAASVAAEVLTQTRTGQVLVEAEVSDAGGWLLEGQADVTIRAVCTFAFRTYRQFWSPGIRGLPVSTSVEWSTDGYSRWQRTVSIWTSLAALRTRLWLIETKQSYPGGFTEAKQSVRLIMLIVCACEWLGELLLQRTARQLHSLGFTLARAAMFPLC